MCRGKDRNCFFCHCFRNEHLTSLFPLILHYTLHHTTGYTIHHTTPHAQGALCIIIICRVPLGVCMASCELHACRGFNGVGYLSVSCWW